MRVFFCPKQAMKNFLNFFQFSGCKPLEKVYNKKAVRKEGWLSGRGSWGEKDIEKKLKKMLTRERKRDIINEQRRWESRAER